MGFGARPSDEHSNSPDLFKKEMYETPRDTIGVIEENEDEFCKTEENRLGLKNKDLNPRQLLNLPWHADQKVEATIQK